MKARSSPDIENLADEIAALSGRCSLEADRVICIKAATALRKSYLAQCLDLWRTDMQNAPKDRPFLVYWRRSKIYGVLEWNQDHWEDQDGAEVMAFSDWCEFTGPDTSTVLTSGEDK